MSTAQAIADNHVDSAIGRMVIGAAIEVHKNLGCGFVELMYEERPLLRARPARHLRGKAGAGPGISDRLPWTATRSTSTRRADDAGQDPWPSLPKSVISADRGSLSARMWRTFMNRSLLVALLGGLTLSPAAAHASFWVNFEGGVDSVVSTDVYLKAIGYLDGTARDVTFSNPQPAGGVGVTYFFDSRGYLSRNWPEWMRFFGASLGLTLSRFAVRDWFPPEPGSAEFYYETPLAKPSGVVPVFALMLIARGGLFAGDADPLGLVQPYLAVGPGWMVTRMDSDAAGSSTSWGEVAVVAETGAQWVFAKNRSCGVSLRYRFAVPRFQFQFDGVDTTVAPDQIHSLVVLLRYSVGLGETEEPGNEHQSPEPGE
ncbi:hypothetical protein ACFL6C_11950 [Myxococcota bacterium]